MLGMVEKLSKTVNSIKLPDSFSKWLEMTRENDPIASRLFPLDHAPKGDFEEAKNTVALKELREALERMTHELEQKGPATFNERWNQLPPGTAPGGGAAPGGAAPGVPGQRGGVHGGWRSGALGVPGATLASYHPGGGGVPGGPGGRGSWTGGDAGGGAPPGGIPGGGPDYTRFLGAGVTPHGKQIGGGGGPGGGGGGGPGGGGGGGGRSDAMAPAGTPTSAAGETEVITTNSGAKFRVAKPLAENFRGFLNDYEAAGGRIQPGTSGGLSTRPGNASYHPLGRAIDVNQTGRNVIRGGLPGGIRQEEALAKKWGLRAGSQFRNPDRGHYEVNSRAAARQALVDQGIIAPPQQAGGGAADAGNKYTFYAPGAAGKMEGGFETSRPNIEGANIPHTLDDVRLGKSPYVSLASDPSRYGQDVNIGDVTYTSPIDGKQYTLHGVKGHIHDTGAAFRGRPDKVDIASGDYRGWSGRAASAQASRNAVLPPVERSVPEPSLARPVPSMGMKVRRRKIGAAGEARSTKCGNIGVRWKSPSNCALKSRLASHSFGDRASAAR